MREHVPTRNELLRGAGFDKFENISAPLAALVDYVRRTCVQMYEDCPICGAVEDRGEAHGETCEYRPAYAPPERKNPIPPFARCANGHAWTVTAWETHVGHVGRPSGLRYDVKPGVCPTCDAHWCTATVNFCGITNTFHAWR